LDLIFSYIYKFLGRYLGVSRHLPQNAKTLIWMIGLYDFSFVVASVFINVFLFRNNGWHVVLVFNMVQFALVMPAFWMGGALSPRFGHRLSYQLGFIFYALLFLSVLLLRESASAHPVFLGVLGGLAIGFYYLGQHALTLDLTDSKDRDYFFALYLFFSSLLKILAPGLSGWIIASFNRGNGATAQSLTGYYVVFAFILLIYLALIAQSFRLKVPRRTGDFKF
jgi:MFS transporter, YQGE family, putative transporter